MTPAFRTFLAVALGVVTVAAAEKASTYQTGAQWLLVLLLGVAFVVALCAVAGVVFAVASAATIEWWWRRRAARYTPPERPLWLTAHEPMDPLSVDASLHWNQVYAAWATGEIGADARHAAREASAEAEQAPWSPPMAEPVGGGR